MAASAEFHATNLARLRAQARETPAPQVSQNRPYKAVVYIFLNGGADTFNLLMPHTCTGVDLYAQYETYRSPTTIAKANMRTIASSPAQPCATYGLHPQMSALETMYKAPPRPPPSPQPSPLYNLPPAGGGRRCSGRGDVHSEHGSHGRASHQSAV
jgi:uncharacterized protein (DUF1501 family)